MPTTIYFSGSITGGREDAALYRRIVDHLRSRGHRVLAGAVAAPDLGHEGEALASGAIFDRDLAWIEEAAAAAGVLVAEVSRPSIGVGYEVATARYRFEIPVVCLWRPAWSRRCTAMVAGDAGVQLIEYGDDTIAEMLERLDAALAALGQE